MSNLREYIVCLHTFEDLESFYNDMETPGGSLFIPSRAVDVAKRKPVSRNTHYWLSDEEAYEVRKDPRVMFVELTPEELGISFKLTAATQTSNNWNKSKSINNLQHNWGLLRSTEGTQRSNWGRDGTTTVNGTVNLAYTGANVDVVIVDGHFLNTHPEFAVNADGSGGSRFVAYNWYQHNPTVTGGAERTYSYSDTTYNFHGTHTAGIAAGNTHGWARSANIYNLGLVQLQIDSVFDYVFNYIKVFHQNKAINPVTGRKNPTVVNCSFETSLGLKTWDQITQVVYRGTTYNGPFTRAQLEGYGFIFTASGEWFPPTQASSYNVDMLDAIGAGVIICAAAGNTFQKIAEVGDSDWDNSCEISGTTIYYNRGSFASPTSGGTRAIIVGGVGDNTAEYKLFMSATGPRVDIYSPAESINSSWPDASNPYNIPNSYTAYEPADPVLDSRGTGYNFKLSGTSMATPQVAGVIAALMENYYTWTPAQALAYIQTTAGIGQLGEITDPASVYNLKGATNRYLYYSTDGSRPTGPIVATPTYAVVANVGSVNEGGTVTYTITTTNVANGTYYWTNSGSTNASDFSDNSNSGSFTINSNSGSFTRTLRNDLTTESAETIVIQIRTTSITGTVVATALSVTVNDTSTTPTQPTVTGQILSPTIVNPVTNYVYDPISGNTNQHPADGLWGTASRWQGPNPGTLTQTQTNLFTSNIDTNVLPFRTVVGGGPHNVVSYVTAPETIQRPFGDYLEISWGASVDSFSESNGGVAQLSAYTYFKDPDDNYFAILFAIYDNRSEYYNYTPNVGFDTQVFFATTPIGNTKYCTSNNIMVRSDTVGSGYVNYTVRFTKAHFATALADVIAAGATTDWPAPSDWLIHEVGILHEVFQNDPGTQVRSAVSFTSPLVGKTSLPYPTNITFTKGYPSFNTILDGIQCTPGAYDIQSTQANGYNVGAGKMTVRFDWRSHRYWEFNPDAHCAFILRASENHIRGNIITDPVTGKQIRGNQGTGLLFGNLSGYSNPITGHVGNPISPSTIIETWYQPNGYGNDLLPGSWGTMVLQDDVTYQTEINAIIDNNGRSFVSYKLTSGGITIFDCPPIDDNNIWYDPTNTGLIIGHVFDSGNDDPTNPWNININNLAVTWSASTPTFAITPDKTTVNEGDTITWTVSTTNIPNGTVLYWTRAGAGINQNDFDNGFVIAPYDGYSGTVIINNNRGTFTNITVRDNLTEGTETEIMSIRQESPLGSVVATSVGVVILDTSTTPLSNDATLSALTISGGTLNPSFNSNTTSYTDSVVNEVVTVTPTRNESHATITVNGTLVTSGTESNLINLNVGSNTITVVVTAQDGTTVKTYTITLTRLPPLSNDATLSALTISGGALNPSFNSNTLSYKDFVVNEVSSVTVTPTRNESHATITVNGTLVTSGTASNLINLNVGSNIIIIVVTAQDSTTVKIYTINVIREIGDDEWVKGSYLGSISTGVISDLYVLAREVKSNYTIKYELISGALPQGLTLSRDGTIVGSAEYGTAGVYSFTVLASDIYELGAIARTFSLTVIELSDTKYTSIYVRPFLPQEKRIEYRDFIGNSFTFDPSLIYRYFDPNFGVQHDIKMVIDFGIEQLNLDQYAFALRQNFYRRTFYFGDVKTAIASDDAGNTIYEVVYVDIIDNIQGSNMMINNNGKDYYPASIGNMRQRLSSIDLPNYSTIKVNRDLQPKFMITQQAGEYQIPNYMHVVPLCYALPGQGSRIVSRIKISGFDFKQLSFEVDRLIVQNSLDNSSAKYLLLERQSLSDTVKSDNLLYEGTFDWQFDDNVVLTRN
jgi:hypothetical protein